MQALQFLDVALFGDVVEGFPEGVVATVEAFDEVSGIDERLSARLPAEIVGAVGVDGVGIAL